MAQYNKRTNEYVDRNNDLFDVVLIGDEVGGITSRRYSNDAWGRPKSVQDYSIFSGTWTFSVPKRVWEQTDIDITGGIDNIIAVQKNIDDVNIKSREGMLSVLSGTSSLNGHVCRSKTFPRYQPNKGQLFSTAIACPNPEYTGQRFWGLSSAADGVLFRLEGDGSDWELYAFRRRANNIEMKIPLRQYLPDDFDPSKGHVYDIQFEWRGVGNFYFFVDLDLIYTDEILGTLDYLSIEDPALPVSFGATCLEDGVEVELLSGCVDVSSEGGKEERTLFGTVNTGSSLITLGTASVATAILAIKIPRTLDYYGTDKLNSRGAIMDKLVSWTRDESITRVWISRDYNAPTVNSLTWNQQFDSFIEYASGGTAGALDVAFQTDKANFFEVVNEWADIDQKNVITNPAHNSDFSLTPGDILVVTVTSTGAANVKSSASLYFSEQL